MTSLTLVSFNRPLNRSEAQLNIPLTTDNNYQLHQSLQYFWTSETFVIDIDI